MTPEQQLKQLLTEAEQVTTKMREALAKMEVPVQWTPKKGDWAEVIDVNSCYIMAGIKIGDVVQIDEDNNFTPYCLLSNGGRWAIGLDQLRHLPDYQPKQKLATTYAEVVEAVNPKWACYVNGDIEESLDVDSYQLPTEAAVKQDKAFAQIKNLEAYCAERFEGERNWAIKITSEGRLFKDPITLAPFKFTKEAADFVIQHFPETFKTYYGVK